MQENETFVFQADSDIVNESYSKKPNYLIEYDAVGTGTVDKPCCALYFSSNDIYYPNDKPTFRKQIIEKNRFEWYGTRIKRAQKHVFLRDLRKQWYLNGLNSSINNPSDLLKFLENETRGYTIITVGSSAGGFAAVLFGQLLKAKQTYSFNGQFEIGSLLTKSNETIDPVVFRNRKNQSLNKYFDTLTFITDPSTIYYFTSNKSQDDSEQLSHVGDLGINIFGFHTSHHGIPFIKSALPELLNMELSKLMAEQGNKLNPILFSIRVSGIMTTLNGITQILKKLISI